VKFQAYVDPRVVIYDRNRFIVQATDVPVIKIFSSTLNLGQNKLECSSVIIFSRYLHLRIFQDWSSSADRDEITSKAGLKQVST